MCCESRGGRRQRHVTFFRSDVVHHLETVVLGEDIFFKDDKMINVFLPILPYQLTVLGLSFFFYKQKVKNTSKLLVLPSLFKCARMAFWRQIVMQLLAQQTDSLRLPDWGVFRQILKPVYGVFSLGFRLRGCGHLAHWWTGFRTLLTENARMSTFKRKRKNSLFTFTQNMNKSTNNCLLNAFEQNTAKHTVRLFSSTGKKRTKQNCLSIQFNSISLMSLEVVQTTN